MPKIIDYSKLEIEPNIETAQWWAGTKEHKYLVRQCNACKHKWFPPSPMCERCNSMDIGWYETAGKGVIHSYTVVAQAVMEAFAKTVPYVVALIELDDCKEPDGTAIRVFGVLQDDDDAAAIGLPVHVVFEPSSNPSIVVARWKISSSVPGAWKFTG